MYNEERPSRGKGLISALIKLLILVVFIFLLVWLFPTKESLKPLYQDVFRNNINSMKDAAETYFTNERLPQNVGDKVKITLKEMLDKNLLLPFVDKYGKECDLNKSYVEITKTETEYEMKVYLVCSQEESYIIEHMGCYDKCDENNCTNTKIAKEYQYQKEVKEKIVSSYKCANGYTLKGNKCIKQEKTTTKIAATPVYKENKPIKPTETVKVIENATYSDWSDWSENKVYDPNNNNITWGAQELVWNEKNGAKKYTTYKIIEDKNQPIYEITYDNLVGTYKQYLCSSFNYYKDSVSQTVYQYGDWISQGRKIYDYVPTPTNSTKYVFIGMDFDSCGSTCTLKPYYIFEVYTRSLKAVTQTTEELKATCNVEEKTINVYGKKKTFVGYVSDKIPVGTEYEYLYHTKTRTILKEAVTETTLSCPTGYNLKDNICYPETTKVLIGYTCPKDYDERIGKYCYKHDTKTITKDATPIYKTVDSIRYKWSTKTSLEGWNKTGKTRNTTVSIKTGATCTCN